MSNRNERVEEPSKSSKHYRASGMKRPQFLHPVEGAGLWEGSQLVICLDLKQDYSKNNEQLVQGFVIVVPIGGLFMCNFHFRWQQLLYRIRILSRRHLLPRIMYHFTFIQIFTFLDLTVEALKSIQYEVCILRSEAIRRSKIISAAGSDEIQDF